MKTWLITGASSGIGRGIAEAVLKSGDQAVVTARDENKLSDLVNQYPEQVLAVSLEVTDAASRHQAVEKTIERFGSVDVLVNNAGKGFFGSVEGSKEEDIRLLFETNFFGPVGMIREVLPYMRQKKSGMIIDISSMGVMFENGMGNAYYVASKAALELMSEVLANEVRPLGIDVMVVEPGTFRTEFRTGAIGEADHMKDYEQTAGKSAQYLKDHPYNQSGDPKKAGQAIVQAVSMETKPQVLVLGKGMIEASEEKMAHRKDEIEKWRSLSESTDF